jgi:large subunit ribosomal protein L35
LLALSDPAAMPKQKTKKGVVKRMKLTKTGKVKRGQAFTSHLLVRRSRKRKRHLRASVLCVGKIAKKMVMALGEG